MLERYHHLAPLSRIALLVAAGDFVTKEAAARWITRDPHAFGEWMRFAVIHNERAAFGLSLGAYTWQLNLALTLAAIVFVIPVSRDLARVDPGAPTALGLIVGGALGNLASLVLSPHGVVDFIAVKFGGSSTLVLNVADVAAYVGLALVIRTGFRIVAAMRAHVRPEVRDPAQTVSLVSLTLSDREVPRAVHREPSLALDGVADSVASELENAPLADTPVARPPVRMLEFPPDRMRTEDLKRELEMLDRPPPADQ